MKSRNILRQWGVAVGGLTVALSLMAGCSSAMGAELPARGKISKNIYSFPYENSVDVDANHDYITHGLSPSGVTGGYDLKGTEEGRTIVAAAAGRVVYAFDENDDCGCHEDYRPCANGVRIQHENGELSVYAHVAKNSILVSEGDCVQRGDLLATEGDVGWTCGTTRSPSADVCLNVVPDGAGDCGTHLHWHVLRQYADTSEYIIPIICNVSNNFIYQGNTYNVADCDISNCNSFEYAVDSLQSLGTYDFIQASDSVVADTFVVLDSASAVLHAGSRIALRPPFRIGPGAYFRAEIGPCNVTPSAGCPPPAPSVLGPEQAVGDGID